MRFSPPDEDVELYKQGFDEDILNRVRAGKALSELLERIEDPLVVALDGRWGTGKTYFLKRWVGAHTLQNEGKATTVYFDAFAHDYLSDPLVALVGALSERTPKTRQTRLKRVQKAASKLAKRLGRRLGGISFGRR
jgi:predicted KAP-like P-loop ATPase